jgi:hypothetical protein
MQIRYSNSRENAEEIEVSHNPPLPADLRRPVPQPFRIGEELERP